MVFGVFVLDYIRIFYIERYVLIFTKTM